MVVSGQPIKFSFLSSNGDMQIGYVHASSVVVSVWKFSFRELAI